MSNNAPKEWVKDKRQRQKEQEHSDKPKCLH